VDCVVIGAGVIGLAVARELAMAGREVIVLERAGAIGTETSSRNSEVIHAGLYYPADSLKAKFCAPGRALLYDYCRSHGIQHRRIGKLVVASREAEIGTLDGIAAHARVNGVDDLEFLEGPKARTLEPALNVSGALLSPSTGIIDSHAYMLALQGEAGDHGALFAFQAPIGGGSLEKDGIVLQVGGAEPVSLRARLVVNVTGLAARKVALSINGVVAGSVPELKFAKGNYFGLTGKAPFSRLIYPVPEPGGLGVHLTLDLTGRARFGPDVEWLDQPHYAVNTERALPFYAAIRRYWPALPEGALYPDYAGVRVKIAGIEPNDFLIETSNPPLINLFGFESPGLTASLAIAREVGRIASQM
ncbi:MAG: NAD(P)/FAD-dependent oxidoreductase, partial [Hyphomicrobiales bacterium]|nr:NAD(P)/FAD-dependent oxidoreductase [Hyphomicrobiales bacterium]